jgi:hypothetical protein
MNRELKLVKGGMNRTETSPLVAAVSQDTDLKGSANGGYRGLCPFHDHTDGSSLVVDSSRDLWFCFGCGHGGNLETYIQMHRREDDDDFVRARFGGWTWHLNWTYRSQMLKQTWQDLYAALRGGPSIVSRRRAS